MTNQPTDDERLRARAPPAVDAGRVGHAERVAHAERVEHPVMRQVWRHLAFLHWPIDPAAVARLLPPGLHVDTFDGRAYVGIVPFTIPLSRTAGLGIPIAPKFHEVNLRTYVHRDGRSPGVWFFSLDAASRLAVAAARLMYGLPYFHARMSMQITGDSANPIVAYQSRRRSRSPRDSDGPCEFRARYQSTGPAAAAAPGTLEFFLAERYLLYAWNGRALRTARVHHSPYPLQPATVVDLNETLTAAAGLPPTVGAPAHVHYAREVDVRIHRPRRVVP